MSLNQNENNDKQTSNFLKQILSLLHEDNDNRISLPLFIRQLKIAMRDEFNADIYTGANNTLNVLFHNGERFTLKVEKENPSQCLQIL